MKAVPTLYDLLSSCTTHKDEPHWRSFYGQKKKVTYGQKKKVTRKNKR